MKFIKSRYQITTKHAALEYTYTAQWIENGFLIIFDILQFKFALLIRISWKIASI